MPLSNDAPRWAPKVPRSLIRRLYEMDARGICDAELVIEVGWALWQRCESILTVTAAHHGRVRCPACGTMIARADPRMAEEVVGCPQCGWLLP